MPRCSSRARTTRSAEKIATEIESVGGHIDSYGGNNSFGINAEVLSEDFATGLDLLADVILNPIFPADELEREKEIQIAGIRSRKDELLKSASLAMRRALFGDAGYGLDSLGTEESAAKVSVADLKSFHQKLTVPNNCVLAIFGDVKMAEVKTAVEKAFAGLESAADKFEHSTVQHPTSNDPIAWKRRATRNRPCWSSVFPARRWPTTTVTRST